MTTKTKKASKASKKTAKASAPELVHQMRADKPMVALCGKKGRGVTLTPELFPSAGDTACPECVHVAEHMLAKKLAQPEEMAKTQAGIEATDKVKAKRAAKEPKEARVDARLPPVGTIIRKLDRAGQTRCECKVLEQGAIEYNRSTFKSLSAAAKAAAIDLGIKAKALNGYAFWGIIKPSGRSPEETLNTAWARYLAIARGVFGIPENNVSLSLQQGNADDKLGEMAERQGLLMEMAAALGK